MRYLPESIHWLVANGRANEAEKILKQAARFNNIKIPNNIFTDPGGQKYVNGKVFFNFLLNIENID